VKGVVDIGEISLRLQDFGPESRVSGTGYACKVDRLASSAEVAVALGRQRQHAATTASGRLARDPIQIPI